MQITTAVAAKSFAALLATGLGTLGGFNYVSGGNIWGTGNDFPTLPSRTSISSVATDYAPAAPTTTPAVETPAEPLIESAPVTQDPEAQSPEAQSLEQDTPTTEADGSCCTSISRAGFLAGSQPADSADGAEIDPDADGE